MDARRHAFYRLLPAREPEIEAETVRFGCNRIVEATVVVHDYLGQGWAWRYSMDEAEWQSWAPDITLELVAKGKWMQRVLEQLSELQPMVQDPTWEMPQSLPAAAYAGHRRYDTIPIGRPVHEPVHGSVPGTGREEEPGVHKISTEGS